MESPIFLPASYADGKNLTPRQSAKAIGQINHGFEQSFGSQEQPLQSHVTPVVSPEDLVLVDVSSSEPLVASESSWQDLVTHVLLTTRKVDKMAVFDLNGRPVALSEDMQTNESEGVTLVNCLRDPCMNLTRLWMAADSFLCIQGIDKTLVGRSEGSSSAILTALQDGSHVVVFLGQSAARGSFLAELRGSLVLRLQGGLQTASQGKRRLSKQPKQPHQQHHQQQQTQDNSQPLNPAVLVKMMTSAVNRLQVNPDKVL